MNEELKIKKGFLDNIYYNIGKQNNNFWVATTYLKDGEIKFGKWKTYLDSVATIDCVNDENNWKDLAYFESINQRQVIKNEIVLDLEDPAQLNPILEQIKGWKFSVWKTGGKGYHIHLFFDRDMMLKEKENVVKKLGTDIQKCSEKNLIALENSPHWRSGNLKQEVKHE